MAKAESVEDLNQAAPFGEGTAWSVKGGAREARAVSDVPEKSTTTERYHAPGMPEGTPEHIPNNLAVGVETFQSEEIARNEPVRNDWEGEEDEEGVVRTGAKGVPQTSSGIWVAVFFGSIVIVVLGVFVYQYISFLLRS